MPPLPPHAAAAAVWLLPALALAAANTLHPPPCPTGAFQTEPDALDMPAVTQHTDGRVYFAGTSSGGGVLDPHPGDELLGATGGPGSAFVPVSSLSFDQLVRMPGGTFLLPVVSPLGGGDGGRLTKFLHVTIMQPEALTWRPSKASRRATVETFKAKHPTKVFHWPQPPPTPPFCAGTATEAPTTPTPTPTPPPAAPPPPPPPPPPPSPTQPAPAPSPPVDQQTPPTATRTLSPSASPTRGPSEHLYNTTLARRYQRIIIGDPSAFVWIDDTDEWLNYVARTALDSDTGQEHFCSCSLSVDTQGPEQLCLVDALMTHDHAERDCIDICYSLSHPSRSYFRGIGQVVPKLGSSARLAAGICCNTLRMSPRDGYHDFGPALQDKAGATFCFPPPSEYDLIGIRNHAKRLARDDAEARAEAAGRQARQEEALKLDHHTAAKERARLAAEQMAAEAARNNKLEAVAKVADEHAVKAKGAADATAARAAEMEAEEAHKSEETHKGEAAQRKQEQEAASRDAEAKQRRLYGTKADEEQEKRAVLDGGSQAPPLSSAAVAKAAAVEAAEASRVVEAARLAEQERLDEEPKKQGEQAVDNAAVTAEAAVAAEATAAAAEAAAAAAEAVNAAEAAAAVEAAAAAAEAASTAAAAQKKKQYIYNDVTFRVKGPLGLDIVPGSLPLKILGKGRGGLEAGDQLVAVNGEDVSEAESQDEVMEVLIEAPWPRTLRFRRKLVEEVQESARDIAIRRAAQGHIRVLEPALLRDYLIPYKVAEFGRVRPRATGGQLEDEDGGGREGACDFANIEIRIELASPASACLVLPEHGATAAATAAAAAAAASTSSDQSAYSKVIHDQVYVLAKRGACTFQKKAENAEVALFGGVIVVNSDTEIIRMPAQKNFKTKELLPMNFEGQALMIGLEDGLLLDTAIGAWKTMEGPHVLLRATLESFECEGAAGLVQASKKQPPWPEVATALAIENSETVAAAVETAAITLASSNTKATGEVLLWNGDVHSRPLVMAVADFGLTDLTTLARLRPSRVIIGNPFDGCDERGFSSNVRGAWVIVERGSCSFVDKVRNVQRVGGTMAIVINTRKKPVLFPMPKGPEGAQDVKIPAIMLAADAAAEITERLAPNMVGRLHVFGHL